MTQPRMDFSRDGFDVPVRDSHVTNPAEQKRLSGQSLAILRRLQEGPATARELSELSLKYTSRISDLRAAGYHIPKPQEDEATGLSVYRLVPEAMEQRTA